MGQSSVIDPKTGEMVQIDPATGEIAQTEQNNPDLTLQGTNKAGFPVFHGTPTADPTFGSRLAESLGIPTSGDQTEQMGRGIQVVNAPDHPVLTKLANAALGPAGTAAAMVKDYGKNLYDKAVAPTTPEEQVNMQNHPIMEGANQGLKYVLEGPLGPFGGQAASNFAEDAGRGRLGPSAGDFLGTAANLLMLDHGAVPTDETSLNKLTAAAGAKGSKNIEATLDTLKNTASQMPTVNSVGDMLSVVKKTKDNINAEYGNAVGPYANLPISTEPIQQRILSLITPDMEYTAEGRGEIKEIKDAADEYANKEIPETSVAGVQKPERKLWTLGALDSKRSRLAADLSSHNAKEPVSRYTAERGSVKLAIDNAILDALRDTVYPQADKLAAKPDGYFENLKSQQANLIRLESVLNKRIDDLTGRSRESAGTPRLSRLRPGAAVSAEGGVHGYLSEVPRAIVPPNVLKNADKAAKAGFSSGHPVSRAIVMSYPMRALALGTPQQ